MAMPSQTLTREPTDASVSPSPAPLKLLRERVVAWANACANYDEAAALYEQLSPLSNAELQRRGLLRETVARDVCVNCERTGVR